MIVVKERGKASRQGRVIRHIRGWGDSSVVYVVSDNFLFSVV